MTSLLSSSSSILLQNKVGITWASTSRPAIVGLNVVLRNGRIHDNGLLTRAKASVEGNVLEKEAVAGGEKIDIGVVSIHRVGIQCENLERSLDFYHNILGLEINEARPYDKLPYRGAWLWVGSEMIHLMELPNPDPLTGHPEHGGRNRRHKGCIPYTLSKSGRPAIFMRDPDANALEFVQLDS
ncbi:Glyoxalase/fosfomycin resistance/dioxygenase domain [Dillenia turbinata]|uniref:Glyoxalase/fosfomycin resistance/dioxygenase domain n=1 Tax=Dillenia turbinata TaxID=194707 RepID=A0AAN8W7X1_9MAGN